ncbi:MAG TPA: site-specific DNA-methyltransferase [Thermoanaerobaculia bacterium]|nr:site-specific DNA-methyltransferase [Thermoanaerobaculia bacterium]
MSPHDTKLICGDCRDVLRTFADASLDAVITDPPYELELMDFAWDGSGVAFEVAVWREVLRVLKPGGHLLSFGSPRTYHRLASAVESAGFEIRDSIHWIYSNGMPKGIDVSKAIDKRRYDRDAVLRVTAFVRTARNRTDTTNAEIDRYVGTRGMAQHWTSTSQPAVPKLEQWAKLKALLDFGDEMDAEVAQLCERKGKYGEAWERRAITGQYDEGAPGQQWQARYGSGDAAKARERRDEAATPEAREWQGWNTTVKPAHEPIVLARKPMQSSVANNVLQFRTGAMNVGGCRIPREDSNREGRLPTNVILGDEAANDLGSVASFFYVARASPGERRAGVPNDAVHHPTVKPIALMRHLVRLITPPGGIVLDPFTGSGTTGIAAALEEANFVGIERDADYLAIAKARINHWKGESDERRAA